METEKIEILFKKYINGELTREEEVKLFDALQGLSDDLILSWIDRYVDSTIDFSFPQNELYEQIKKQTYTSVTIKKKPKYWSVAAASVILFVSIAYYFLSLMSPMSSTDDVNLQNLHDDSHYEIVLPSNSSAKLTFSDGKELHIDDSTASTTLMNGLLITPTGHDLVEVDWAENSKDNQSYSFTTPKGSSYQVKLHDGTLVWLNSASALKIEPGFNRHNRTVTLEGEAYFRVTSDEALPFKVLALGATVKVLGTHFNVRAYPEENRVDAALEEGSVEVRLDQHYAKLSPGQQASCHLEGNRSIGVKPVDFSTVLSWKDGYFRFDDQGIEEIMNSLRNWYPINEIEYMYLPKEKFTGSLARTNKLSDVLNGLEVISDIKFKIEGRRVVVTR